MIKQSTRFVPHEQRTNIISVTSYRDKCLTGVLYNPCLRRELAFQNLMQFLLQMEELLDEMNFPQRGMESRVFSSPATGPHVHEMRCESDAPVLATFKISVIFRQNASWQGSLFWVEQNAESQFRSVLELAGLLDSALEHVE